MPLEQLAAPPIFEVICGFIFEPVSGLNPVTVGKFWADRKDKYPIQQVHPALSDEPTIVLSGIPPLRVWLISEDDEFVLQLQADRFYLNWRKRGREYPRFRDHDGRKGIRSRLVDEFAEFSAFCKEQFGTAPRVTRIELAKVDQLLETKHWDGFHDLAQLVPWLKHFGAFTRSGDPGLSVRFGEERGGGTLSVSMDLGRVRTQDQETRVLKIETRAVRSLAGFDGDVSELFVAANAELNEAFGTLIPEPQRARFQ